MFMEGLMLKLKLQYFGHLMRRADSFEKTLILQFIGVQLVDQSDAAAFLPHIEQNAFSFLMH